MKKRNVEFKYPDQDILNLALLGEVNELPLSYNIPPYLYILNNYLEKIYLKGRCYTAQDFQLARNSAKILHSYGLCGIKPWCENKVNPFNEEFCKYLQFVDSDFCKEKLDLKLKLLTIHPNLFYLAFISLRFVPREINDRLRLLLK